MPAEDPRLPAVRQREAGHAGPGDEAHPPAAGQGPRVGGHRVVRDPDLARAGRRRDEDAQALRLRPLRRGGREAEDDAIGRAEGPPRPGARHAVRELRHRVALEAPHALDLDRPRVVRATQPDARLAAVHREHAHQPARRSVSDENSAPDTFALSW